MTDRLRELRRAVLAVKVVGQIDGHDVVRRASVIDIIDQRETLRAALAEKRTPVTEEQITDLWVELYRDARGWGTSGSCKIFSDGFRAAERAHGIGDGDE